ncbi:NAD(P)-binding domain-containing protein [Nocardia cyriacigeorgica]|uniref:NAD(P)-binding domain-containing protein n=1 Tax=Nocardia cyriacigeorgica TaxID=135487 RepID=UPI002457CC8E|nr:NAD(P)-binding domain-containing protein [Nocardia cyriacigeorgica]
MRASQEKRYDVLVVGCGLMGSALARTLVRQGNVVAAWNRTPERARALVGDGIVAVDDIENAVRSSRIVLACTATYETTRAALEAVATWEGSTLVNVGSGAPDEVEVIERWAGARGAAYLDGAILCYPQHVGTPDGLFFSGPTQVWQEHEQVLSALGTCTHVSATTRGASVLDVTFAGGFYITALAAYAEAASYALSQGLTAAELTDVTRSVLAMMAGTTEDIARSIETGRHDTDQATIAVFAAGAGMCLEAMRATGHRARILEATTQLLAAAQAAGLGHLGFSAHACLANRSQD